MSRITNDIIKSLRKSLQANDRKTSAYDTQATIRRIEGNTAWVHIPGGVDETPVQLTINASEGDTVQVRVSGGRAFLVGNASAPPTDNAYARQVNRTLTQEIQTTNTVLGGVKKVVQAVKKIADNTNQYFWHTETGTDTGAHITEIPQEDFLADPENGGGNLLARSNGIAVRDGLDELATFSASGVQIGKDDEARTEWDYRSLSMIDKDDSEFFGVKDLRDNNGVAEITETFPVISSELNYCYLSFPANSTTYTVVVYDENGNDVTSQYTIEKRATIAVIIEATTSATGYSATITYTTEAQWAKKLEFGEDGAFNVNGKGDIDFAGKFTKSGEPYIKTTEYILGKVSITSGTPGTTSSVIQRNMTPQINRGYTPIAVKIRYVSTSVIGFNAFFNSDNTTLYVQIIRRQSGAASPDFYAYADVTFIKTS